MVTVKDNPSRHFIMVQIAVLKVTDSRTEETDTSGKALVDRLTET